MSSRDYNRESDTKIRSMTIEQPTEGKTQSNFIMRDSNLVFLVTTSQRSTFDHPKPSQIFPTERKSLILSL